MINFLETVPLELWFGLLVTLMVTLFSIMQNGLIEKLRVRVHNTVEGGNITVYVPVESTDARPLSFPVHRQESRPLITRYYSFFGGTSLFVAAIGLLGLLYSDLRKAEETLWVVTVMLVVALCISIPIIRSVTLFDANKFKNGDVADKARSYYQIGWANILSGLYFISCVALILYY